MDKNPSEVWRRIAIHTVLPAGITTILFIISLFMVYLPFLKETLMNSKKQTAKEIVNSAWTILNHYNDRVLSGELTTAQAQELVIKRIKAMRYGPDQKDYLWINDMTPKMIMHPYLTELDGNDLSDYRDRSGKRIFVEFVNIVADHGEGFTDYMWPRMDNSKLVVPKISFIKGFEPWGWILGSGIYIIDIEKEIAGVTKDLQLTSIIIVCVISILIGYMIYHSGKTESERLNAQEQLSESERTHRLSINNMINGFALHEMIYNDLGKAVDYRFLQVNPAFCTLTGLDDPTGKTVREIIPNLEESWIDTYNKVVTTGIPHKFEQFESTLKKWWEVLAYRTLPGQFACTFADITDRKFAEQTLIESFERFKAVMDSLDAIVYVADMETYEVLFTNKKCDSYYPDTIGKICWKTLQSGQTGPCEFCKNDNLLDIDGKPTGIYKWEFRNTRDNRWYQCHDQAIAWTDGRLVKLEIATDITERKEFEEKLRESENLFRAITENTTDITVVIKPDGSFSYVSPSVKVLNGYSAEEIMKMNINDLGHPEDMPEIWKTVKEAVNNNGQSFNIPYLRSLKPDGSYIELEATVTGMMDVEGVNGIVATCREITERIRSENALKESERKYRFLADNTADYVFQVSMDMKHLYANDAVENIVGYRPEELIGKSVEMLFTHEEYAQILKLIKDNINTEAAYIGKTFETQLIHRDGRVVPVETNARFSFKDGVPESIIGSTRDITERKKAEREREQLLKTLESKNEELQSIVYISSHDLRSPLVNLEGFSGELAISCNELRDKVYSTDNIPVDEKLHSLLDKDIPESLGFIKASTDKMKALVNGLLQLSRIGVTEINIGSLDMNQMLRNISHTMRFQIEEADALLEIGDLVNCRGDWNQINQVITNLIDNALKYRSPKRDCIINVWSSINNGMVNYHIKDNGIGIEEAYRAKVFDIFHQLNPRHKAGGEGLGLTIVKRILDRQNGRITLESSPGEGTTFTVSLPKA